MGPNLSGRLFARVACCLGRLSPGAPVRPGGTDPGEQAAARCVAAVRGWARMDSNHHSRSGGFTGPWALPGPARPRSSGSVPCRSLLFLDPDSSTLPRGTGAGQPGFRPPTVRPRTAPHGRPPWSRAWRAGPTGVRIPTLDPQCGVDHAPFSGRTAPPDRPSPDRPAPRRAHGRADCDTTLLI